MKRVERIHQHLEVVRCASSNTESPFGNATEMASEVAGGKILYATDEWFASADNMLKTNDPIFIPDKFTSFGKWMDGWETRRKRIEGHDWCVIELGLPGTIEGFAFDTKFFTGNYALRCSVRAAKLTDPKHIDICRRLRSSREAYGECIGIAATHDQSELVRELRSDEWTEVVPFTPLGAGNEETRFTYLRTIGKHASRQWTHVRVNIYPDGGVARLRVFGSVRPNFPSDKSTEVDLVAARNGGKVVSFSDAHYGRAANLIAPGRARTMGEGWETARKPDRPPIVRPSANMTKWSDWVVLALGARGVVDRVRIDTNHFKGNFPESCLIECIDRPDLLASPSSKSMNSTKWRTLLPRTRMVAHAERDFRLEHERRPITHVRITMYPDGGISRVRLFGRRV